MAGAVRGGVALATTSLALTLASTHALAANGKRPRTPVVFTDVACMEIVDRSTTPIVHLAYEVAYDDTEKTSDEVEDSRTHQFFAFSSQRLEILPDQALRYITWADIERAALVDDEVVPEDIDPETVLETTSRFTSDEWVRITADDMRVPITMEQAAMGVDWDVSAIPPGTWLVRGYTWEPVENLWSFRWGGIKVIASEAEHHDAGPSVILSLDPDDVLPSGIAHPVLGCVDAPPGSRLTLEYGLAEGTLAPEEWVVFAEDCDVDSGAIALDFVPARELEGSGLYLRATITDPDDRTYVAYGPAVVTIIPGPAGDTDGEPEAEPVARCVGDPPGCSCAQDRKSTPWLLLLLTACLRRRRREANLHP